MPSSFSPSYFSFSYVIIIFLLSILSSFRLSRGVILPKEYYSGTGHLYQVVNNTVSYNDAAAYASSQGGYLVTITDQGEFEFVLALIARYPLTPADNFHVEYWMGIKQNLSSQTFSYSTGPEGASRLPFTSSADTRDCPYVCPWTARHPDNYAQGEEGVLLTSLDPAGPDGFDDALLSLTRVFIIEYGNSSVVSTSVSSSGGNTTIQVLGDPTWVDLVQAIPDVNMWNVTVGREACPVTAVLQGPLLPGIQCLVPPGSGKSLPVTISYYWASNSSWVLSNIRNRPAFSYKPPKMLIISEVKMNTRVTVQGLSFSRDVSTTPTTLLIGNNSAPCVNFVTLVPHYSFSCLVTGVVHTTLPTYITVDGLYEYSYSTMIFNSDNNHFYRLSNTLRSFRDAIQEAQAPFVLPSTIPQDMQDPNATYPLTPGTQQGYLATITSPTESVVVANTGIGLFAWIGAADLSQSGSYSWVSGPEYGMVMSNRNNVSFLYTFYRNNEPQYGPTKDALGLGTNALSLWQAGYSYNKFRYVVEYGGASPPISITTPPMGISTRGGHVTITGLAFGPLAANMNVTIGTYPCRSITILQAYKQISCLLSAGVGARLPVNVKYLTQNQISNGQLYFNYAPPNISSIDPSEVDYSSSISSLIPFTLKGDNFGTDITRIQVHIGGKACLGVTIIDPHTLIQCYLVPDITQRYPIVQVVVGGQSFNLSSSLVVRDYCGDGLCANDTLSYPSFKNESCRTCIQDCGECPIIPCKGIPPCNGRGDCFEGVCNCTSSGWEGEACEIAICPGTPPCNDRGVCVDGFCNCTSPLLWSGTMCDTPVYIPPPLCSCGDGLCTNALLSINCTRPASSSSVYNETCESCPQDCGVCPICPGSPVCNGRGSCVLGDCVCNANWTGAACSVSTLQPNIPANISCPGTPPCNDKGTCSASGECDCISGWGGVDCTSRTSHFNTTTNGTDIIINPIPPTPSLSTTSSSSPSPPPPSFIISVLKLQEVDELGNVKAEFSLAGGSPSIISSDDSRFHHLIDIYPSSSSSSSSSSNVENKRSIYRLMNTTSPSSSSLFGVSSWEYITSLPGTSSTIVLQFATFTSPAIVQFAQHNTTIQPNTLKCTMMISDFSFQNSTNYLQILIAQYVSNPPPSIVSSSCLPSPPRPTSGMDPVGNLKWISVSSGDTTLYGSFPSFILVDGISSYSQVKRVDATTVAMIVPYFTEYVVIDPNFNVLIDANRGGNGVLGSSCGSPSLSAGPDYRLIGGVIGGGAFVIFLVVGLIIGYKLRKKRRDRDSRKSIEMKEEFATTLSQRNSKQVTIEAN
eukprot:TRINITY_DN3955_c0_g2_i1.p1 TRINITY_DN3955_c0_g2~~TRINITY_DN3955_c0_g2_i1.p1  ORF type:complete len:1309 (-),score=224.46 TRINITY_DN3955_c0_g2_i1:15-3941(-)